MIVAGIIAAVVFVIALSRSAGLADRKMEEIYMLSGMSFNAARQSLFIMTLLLTDAPVSMFTTFPPKKHRTPNLSCLSFTF